MKYTVSLTVLTVGALVLLTLSAHSQTASNSSGAAVNSTTSGSASSTQTLSSPSSSSTSSTSQPGKVVKPGDTTDTKLQKKTKPDTKPGDILNPTNPSSLTPLNPNPSSTQNKR